jgi:hypothetical protein
MIIDGYTAKLQEQLIQRRTMLIEEGMSEYIMNRESLKRHCEAMCKKFKNVHTSGIYGEHRLVLNLLEQTEWIPVSERLPEFNKNVLTCRNGGFIEIQSLRDSYDGYWEDQHRCWTDLDEVVAWMPLPEPYRAENRKI